MLSEIQACWFTIEIRKHPAWKYAQEIGLQIHHWALAQHYGIATMFLDMTQSIDVAAFFATSDYVNGAWQPRASGKGVMYQLDFSSIPEAWDRIHLVGLSTFPRPGEQKAWAVPIILQGDFEELPYVEVIEFTHTEDGSKHYSDMFDQGADLFPHGPAADLAEAIRTSKVLPVNCVANALRGLGCPMDRLQLHFDRLTEALKEMWGLEVGSEVPVGLTDEQVANLASYWEIKGKTFLENVGVRPVAIVKADGSWMNTTDAARLIGCTTANCRKLIRSEQLQAIKAYRLGTRKPRYLVSRESVERFLNEHGKPNNAALTSSSAAIGRETEHYE
jgi:hypothetical protein